MWGFCGVAGVLSVILIFLWCLAYFRSQFGPLFCDDCPDDWLAGLWNIRVHQMLVLSGGTMFAVTLGKFLAIALQFAYLSMRMKQLTRKVEDFVAKKKEKGGIMAYLGSPSDSLLSMVSGPLAPLDETAGLVDPGPKACRKILICEASVGAGHKRAAEAVQEALRQECPRVEVKMIDLMDAKFADRVFIYFYKDWYLKLVSGQSMLAGMGNLCVGFFFDKSNHVQEGTLTGGGFLNNRRLCMSLTLNFLDFVCAFEPDLIIHTHFLAPEIIAGLRRHHEGFDIPHVTVITDMDVHAWWYQEPCEKYFVPRDLCAYQLQLAGVDKENLVVSGIPIMPHFADMLRAIQDLSIEEKRKRFKANMDIDVQLWDSSTDNRPVIVVMSTGSGVLDLFENLIKLQTPSIIVVVCGRQADVRSSLEQIKVPSRHRACFLGYTKTMHELMGVADVVVSKPGGLITSEALACGLMFVIVDPYAGQEERNAAMLLEAGAGIQVHHYYIIAFRLDPVLRNTELLVKYKKNSKELGKPNAARDVVKRIVQDRILVLDDIETPGAPQSRDTSRNSGQGGLSPPKIQPRERSESTTSSSPLHWFDVPDTTAKRTSK